MKTYNHNSTHERVMFDDLDVVNIQKYITIPTNTHPAWLNIKSKFAFGGSVNISKAQCDVLERTLSFAGLPSLDKIVAEQVVGIAIGTKLDKESAVRSVMVMLENSYGDWTFKDEYQDLPKGFYTMSIGTSTGKVYMAFQSKMDLNTAEIALEESPYF